MRADTREPCCYSPTEISGRWSVCHGTEMKMTRRQCLKQKVTQVNVEVEVRALDVIYTCRSALVLPKLLF